MQLLKVLMPALALVTQVAGHVQEALRRGEIPVKGVNLGGWLVAEHWLSEGSVIWQGVPTEIANQGEYKTMEFLGHERGDSLFQWHRATWITENDIAEMAKYGLNTVRVPVGFWITGFDQSDPPHQEQWRMYAPGALDWLDFLVNDWALKYNLAVLVDLHAHKGSQNGADHSAPVFGGEHNWSAYPENVENSLQVATFLAARYKDSPAFLGLGLLNEPTQPINMDVVQDYYKQAYQRIRETGNECVLVVSPALNEQNPSSMQDFMRWPEYHNVWHDWHPYFVWGFENKSEEEVLAAVRAYADNLKQWQGNWLFLGEWSLGSPASAPFEDLERKKEFARAQLESFSNAHSGWTFWSWHHSDDDIGKATGWSMRQNLRNGVIKLQ